MHCLTRVRILKFVCKLALPSRLVPGQTTQVWQAGGILTGLEEVLDWVPCSEADIGRLSSACGDVISRRELPSAITILPEVYQVARVRLFWHDRRWESEPTLRDDEGGLTPTVEVDQLFLCVRT